MKEFLTDLSEQWLTKDGKGLAAAFVVGLLATIVVVLAVAGLVTLYG